MTKIRFGTSYWLDVTPRRRRPVFPRQRGPMSVDVAIVGGGLTGCITAYLFAHAGVKVVLLEKNRIGEGSTAASPGLLLSDPRPDFRSIAGEYGLRAARRIWQATRRSASDCAATIRRLGLRCGLSRQDSIVVASSIDDLKMLRKEFEARKAAGLDVRWLKPAALRARLGFEGNGAIGMGGGGLLDPFRACLGFARAAAQHRAQIFEGSSVLRIKTNRRDVELKTERGVVTARRVIIATGSAGPDVRSLMRHFNLVSTFFVVTPRLPMTLRRQFGVRDAIVRDTERPAHTLRWIDDERIVFGGADLPRVEERKKPKVLVQRTGQLMYELSKLYPVISGIQPEYAWDATSAESSDGLPLIGPHRNYPHHLFAIGYGANSGTFAYLAAKVLLRQYQEAPEKGDELFGFGRWRATEA